MPISFLQSAVNATGQTTYTFSSQNLGSAASDRHVIVGVSARGLGTTRTISSVTIGGVTATAAASVAATGGGNTSRIALYIAAVPTGTSGNVVITFDSAMLRCGIGLWRATSLASATPTDTATSTADDPTQNTLDVTEDGFAIGVAYNPVNSLGASWTGITEDYDESLTGDTGNEHTGAHSEFASAQTNLTITCNFSDPQSGLGGGAFASWEVTPVTNVTVEPSPLTATFSLPATTITAVQNVASSPNALSASFSLPAATISGAATITPAPLSATLSLPQSDVQIPDVTITPSALSATFSAPSPTINTDMLVAVSPLSAAFSTPSPTVSVVANQILTPSPLSLTFNLQAPTRTGQLWNNRSRETATFTNRSRNSATWTNRSRNSATWTNRAREAL